MKILVLGAGAVGGYFGGRLADGGADVTFLVRDRRRQQLIANGLRVTSPLGDIARPVQALTADELSPMYDLVLLTCKAYDLESSMASIAPAIGAQTVIVPLLNGLAHLERLDERFGRARVLGGTCLIDSTLAADGRVVHGGRLQRLVFGERDGSRTARADAFAAALARTVIDWEQSPAIVQTMWDKITFLAALATGTCLFRGNVREIVAAPGGREAMARALAANVEIAAKEGFPIGAAALEFARDRLTDPQGLQSASMMRDLESGGRIEADHIIGWLLERARRHGVDDTMLSLAFTHLKTYEQRRAANRLPHA